MQIDGRMEELPLHWLFGRHPVSRPSCEVIMQSISDHVPLLQPLVRDVEVRDASQTQTTPDK